MHVLEESWGQIVDLTQDRHQKLRESENYQNFIARVEEEEVYEPNEIANIFLFPGLVK